MNSRQHAGLAGPEVCFRTGRKRVREPRDERLGSRGLGVRAEGRVSVESVEERRQQAS